MTAYDDIMREYREFKRYTGDGLPGAPVNAPLPVGDPQSGPWNPKKANLRLALGNLAQELMDGVAYVGGTIPAINDARATALGDIGTARTNAINDVKSWTPEYAQVTREAVRAAEIATAADRVQTGADVAATGANVALANAAKDAAFVNANVYPDIATGRAAVADGQQFQVVSGLETIRYRRDSSTTQTEVARFPTAAAVDRVAGLQVIGKPAAVASGTPVSNRTYVFATPVAVKSSMKRVRAWMNASGQLAIKRFGRSGDNFTQIGSDVSLNLAAGANDIALNSPIAFEAGEYIGFYGSPNLTYTAEVSDSGGVYDQNSNTGNVSAFADASPNSSVRLQIGFDFAFLGALSDLAAKQDEEGKRLSSLLSASQTIGFSASPNIGTNVGTNRPFVFATPLSQDCALRRIRFYSAASGKIRLKRFLKYGSHFSQVGDDYVVDVVGGVNTIDLKFFMNFKKGDYLGIFAGTLLKYEIGTGAHFYNPATNTGNVGSFSSSDAVTDTVIEFGADFVAGRVQKADAAVDHVSHGFGEMIDGGFITTSNLSVSFEGSLFSNGGMLPIADSRLLTAPSAGTARYDLLVFDRATDAFAVIVGTERATDPTAFIPKPASSSQIPVALLRVADGSILPVRLWNIFDGNDRLLALPLEQERSRSRSCLPKWLNKVRRKDSVRILGFGDSITNVGDASAPAGAPNGAIRDTAANSGANRYLRISYGSDIVDALPLYTAVQLGRADDGAGAVHSRVGWNWGLVNALEKQGYTLGTDLFYDNFGINGARTTGAISSGVPTGWLNNAIALNADLVVIGFGMNELGSATTEAALVLIAQAFKAVGSEVVFVEVPRPRTLSYINWQYTNRAIRRAALFTESALLPMSPLYDNDTIGAVGIAPADVCAANSTNHPGIEEFAAIGRELARLVI